MVVRSLHRLILLALLVGLVSGPSAPAQAFAHWQTRVDAQVLAEAAVGESEFLVIMSDQADLRAAAALPDKKSKGRYVYETLTRFAESSQAGLLRSLQAAGAQTRSYWIANLIWVRGNLPDVQAAASRSDVYRVIANPWVRGDLGEPAGPDPASPSATDATEWNLDLVGAPQSWLAGYTGENVVIGGQDTGYEWDHPALINSYRGWDGSLADHRYNWYDAIHAEITPSTNPCGMDSQAPCDDHGHGTHTMGIMVGDDGGANQVGMAPGARWIGCRNMESGYGKPSTYIECYQWFLAPTDLDGTNPKPDLAPHIINNSWACPTYEGCTDPWVMETVVNNLAAAGILSVHSAGNSGPSCNTVSDPAQIYTSSFTVGNTTSLDSLAASSSRGPVSVDGSGRRKPDISAPGTGIYSSFLNDRYIYMTGTSMAAPHVAGLAALLISANPGLEGQPDTLRRIIEMTANPNVLVPDQTCGGIPSTTVPNNQFGWGRIDALQAVDLALSLLAGLTPKVDAPAVLSGAQAQIPFHMTNTMPAGSGLDLGRTLLQTTIPPETTFISATLPYIRSGDLITWTAESLPAGSAYTATLALTAPTVLYAEIPIQALAGPASRLSQHAGSTLIVTALQTSLSGPPQSQATLPLTYTLSIRNTHPADELAALVASSPVPAGTVLRSASPPYTLSDGTLSWTRDVLGPGQTWTITFSLEPGQDAWHATPLLKLAASSQAAGILAPASSEFLTLLLAPYVSHLPVIRR